MDNTKLRLKNVVGFVAKPAERYFSTLKTPYFRTKHLRSKSNQVTNLSVEGVYKSAISKLTDPLRVPLITTDGYKIHERAILTYFGKCLSAQNIKTRRNDRVTKMDHRIVIGDKRDLEKAIQRSESSGPLNSSFVERFNLTIRQLPSFLTKRTTSSHRFQKFLEKQLDILRPHRALKFGPEIRTQAGLGETRHPLLVSLVLILVRFRLMLSSMSRIKLPYKFSTSVQRGNWMFMGMFLFMTQLSAIEPLAEPFESRIGGFIQDYCLECHSSQKKKGDLDLEAMLTPGAYARHFKEWGWVREQLESRDMPPKKAKQPGTDLVKEMLGLIQAEAKRSSNLHPGDPGPVVVRRLTSAEYIYAIKDLTDLDMDSLRSVLPEDAVGGEGFANIGEVQFLQDASLERYLESARKIASHAIIGAGDLAFFQDPGDTGFELSAIRRIQSIYREHGFRSGAGEGAKPYGLEMFPKAFLVVWMHHYRQEFGLPDWSISQFAEYFGISSKFAVHIENSLTRKHEYPSLQEIHEFWVKAPRPESTDLTKEADRLTPYFERLFKLVQRWQKSFAKQARHREESALLDAHSSGIEGTTEASVFAKFFPSVSHREPAPSDRDPIPQPYDNSYNNAERNAWHYQVKYHRDDSFLVDHILPNHTIHELEIAWNDLFASFDYHQANLNLLAKHFHAFEKDVPDVDALTQRDVQDLSSDASPWIESLIQHRGAVLKAMAQSVPAHIEQCIDFARKAWRRPLSLKEAEALRAYYRQSREEDLLTHQDAIRLVLTRILVSPHFLFRLESQEKSEVIVDLSPYEKAARLSFLLWASIPDDELYNATRKGELDTMTGLKSNLNRMLKDARTSRFATEFFGQWFGFYRFDRFQGVDATQFDEWTPELRSSLYEEAKIFFTKLVEEDRAIDEILFADRVYLNATLARHYGLPLEGMSNEDVFLKVQLETTNQRGGLLGMGAVHAITSAPLRTSIVKRGDWILRRILGTPVPPPPADAGSISTEGQAAQGKSIRELLQAHQADASCVNCHARMDPLGFALEAFDVTGKNREMYRNGLPVESVGHLRDGTKVQGFDGLRTYLKNNIHLFHRTFCTKLIGYAFGRRELLSDHALVDRLMDSLANKEQISRQIEIVVSSPQFCRKRGSMFTSTDPD